MFCNTSSSVQGIGLKKSSFKLWHHVQITGFHSLTRLFALTPVNIDSSPLVMTPDRFLLTGGPIHVSFPSGLTLAEVHRKNPLVVRGGRYRPSDCEARHRTAIIIPHRHREHHLKFLLYYLHPFLQRQQLSYGIYVIHQVKLTQPSDILFSEGSFKGWIRD